MGHIQDTRFEFRPSRDFAQEVANELLAAGLIVGQDLGAVTDNLQLLITKPPRSRMITFRTTIGMAVGDIPDERTLTGFAKLSQDSLGPVYGAPA